MHKSGKNRAFIALGSNLKIPLGDLKNVAHSLIENVNEDNIALESISPYYRTPAFPKNAGPDFVNAAFALSTNLSPQALLQELHKIENQYGRERHYRWSPRTLDLDLIFYEDQILPDPESWQEWANLSLQEAQNKTPEQLILPHPRMHERAFVLGPLNDIAPDFVHPVYDLNIRTLWEQLNPEERAAIKII